MKGQAEKLLGYVVAPFNWNKRFAEVAKDKKWRKVFEKLGGVRIRKAKYSSRKRKDLIKLIDKVIRKRRKK